MKRTTSTLVILLSLLALLATSTQAGASTGSRDRSIVPVAALRAAASTKPQRSVAKHGFGALLPKKKVAVKRPARKLMAALPASVDLSAYMVPVGDQGSLGSCVTWAIDYAMLGWYSRHDNKPGQPFNPMYTYSQIHAPEPGGGSYPDDAMRIAREQGNDTMAHYSHSTTDYLSQPNASERASAANYKVVTDTPLFALNGGGGSAGAEKIQAALAGGKPVAIGMALRDGFMTMANSPTTLDDDVTTSINDPVTGKPRYHEILAIAYDQYGLWIQNSWGTNWGYKGLGHISWRVVASDVYQAHTISGFASTPTADTTRPTIAKPDARLALGTVTGTPTAATVPVDAFWSASDASGIKKYLVYLQQDSGPSNPVTLSSDTATSQRLFLASGHSYTVWVQAQDGAGNWGAAYATDTFSVSVVDDATWSFSSWTRYPFSDAFGGSYLASMAAGSWFSYTERARDIGLLAVKFSGGGRPYVSHDGINDGTVDLSSATSQGRQLVYWAHFPDPSLQHSIKVVTGSGWATVDGIVLLR
jgi:Papain family cysteine protease